MSVPLITAADLDALADLAPDLDFNDAERRAVLLEAGACDVNAAPGSGKTTILAAKLLLLARQWPHARRGICVLSHTNVARDEIRARLSASPDGALLLHYPHFIGTIHAFVNQFLALPLLRSHGIAVDVIDDDVFAQKALAKAENNWTIRAWMQNDQGVAPMIGGLVFQGPHLALASENGKLPSASAKSYPGLEKIKTELTGLGVFRHADMFAFAESLLHAAPTLKDRLAHRFPLVFIDEMQDTSWSQESLLRGAFGAATTVQRYGDVNQRIIAELEDMDLLTFPRASALPISTSKRFGPTIAQVVAGVQLAGKPVIGERADSHPPMLIVYESGTIDQVITEFGRQVLERFDDVALKGQLVKALCARKQGDSQVVPGRHLGDYWPAAAGKAAQSGAMQLRFWDLLAHAPRLAKKSGKLADATICIRRALLLVLRAANCTAIDGVREASLLLSRLHRNGHDTSALRQLTRELLLSNADYADPVVRASVLSKIFSATAPLMAGCDIDVFSKLPLFAEEPGAVTVAPDSPDACTVAHNGRSIVIPIGTVASMKGETHLSTLVLESYGGTSRKFDLAEALPILAGLRQFPKKPGKLLPGQFRNIYVGMSRPTSFLCLACNAARVDKEALDALVAAGWEVRRL